MRVERCWKTGKMWKRDVENISMNVKDGGPVVVTAVVLNGGGGGVYREESIT